MAYSDVFTELSELAAKGFTYHPMTDAEFQVSYVNDIVEWASEIAGEWNGDEPGSQEDRAHLANDIIEKCAELVEMIKGMEEL